MFVHKKYYSVIKESNLPMFKYYVIKMLTSELNRVIPCHRL